MKDIQCKHQFCVILHHVVVDCFSLYFISYQREFVYFGKKGIFSFVYKLLLYEMVMGMYCVLWYFIYMRWRKMVNKG